MGQGETLIVIPAYNESKRLARTLAELEEVTSQVQADTIVVDDGSCDQTGVLARRNGYVCLSLPFHAGYGTALQTGYKYAVRKGYRFLVQMDADGQHDPRFLPAILGELREGRADVIVGSRFLRHRQDSPPPRQPMYYATPLRRLGIRLFRAILRLWGLSITDPTSGFIGFTRRAFEFLASDVFPFDYPDADVLLLLHRNGFTIREIPVYMYANPERGSIHRGCAPFWYVIKEFLAVVFAGVRRKETI